MGCYPLRVACIYREHRMTDLKHFSWKFCLQSITFWIPVYTPVRNPKETVSILRGIVPWNNYIKCKFIIKIYSFWTSATQYRRYCATEAMHFFKGYTHIFTLSNIFDARLIRYFESFYFHLVFWAKVMLLCLCGSQCVCWG